MITLDNFTHPDFYGWMFRTVKNSNMKRVNLPVLFALGESLGYLPTVFHADMFYGEKSQIVSSAGMWVGFFLKETENVSLKKTRVIAQKLFDAIRSYSSDLVKEIPLSEEKILAHKVGINHLIKEFEKSFKDESDDKVRCFLVTKKGIYDTVELAENAEQVFESKVLKHLSKTAIYDIREAGRCLAFDCYTAMAFHLFRATETVILKYYEVLAGHNWNDGLNPKKDEKNWNAYIQSLLKLKAPHLITQRLHEIRKYNRNEIAHPETIIEAETALPVFNLVSGVIPLMAQEIEKIETAKTPMV